MQLEEAPFPFAVDRPVHGNALVSVIDPELISNDGNSRLTTDSFYCTEIVCNKNQHQSNQQTSDFAAF